MLIYFLSGCDMTYAQDANDGYGFGCDGEDKTPFVFEQTPPQSITGCRALYSI